MMEQISVAIVSDDLYYAHALARALNYRCSAIRTAIWKCDDYISQWRVRGHSLRDDSDIILWDGEDGEYIYGGNIVWIRAREVATDSAPARDGSGHANDDGQERYSIYRYDTASMILSRLLDIYGRLTGERPRVENGRDAKVFTFVSWRGGTGCTTVCRALGQDLVRFFGIRVLVMTLDGFGSCGMGPEDRDPAYSIDAFLYRFFHRRDSLVTDVEMFLARDGYGLSSFAPSLGRNPLPGLSEEEAGELIEDLACGDLFDVVLIDAGSCCSDAAAAMIAFADRVCCIEGGNVEGREVSSEERYISWIENATEESGKIVRVLNGVPSDRGGGTSDRRGGSPDRRGVAPDRLSQLNDTEGDGATIHIAPRSETSDEILLEGEFGNNIHALAEALWYNNQ